VKGGWSDFAKRQVLLVGIVVMVVGCGKDEIENREPITVLKMDWEHTPPSQWAASSQPVYKVNVIPTIPDTNLVSTDTLDMRIVVKVGNALKYGNRLRGPCLTFAFITNSIVLEIGGEISSTNVDSVEVWAIGKIFRNGVSIAYDDTPHGYFRFLSNNPSRTISTEYDHQFSFNVFSRAPNGEDSVNRAFGVTTKEIDMVLNDPNLTDEELQVANSGEILPLIIYVLNRRQLHPSGQPVFPMYLVGVQDLSINPEARLAGRTLIPDGPQYENQRSTLIFVEFVDTIARWDSFDATVRQVMNKFLVHEFGHQVANLTEANGSPQLHNSPFCVMTQDIRWYIAWGENDDTDRNNFARGQMTNFENPFFCPKDVELINAATVP